jgi:2,4-dienoyl-CoA reductase-like NADH-dependent reductase (Old Yellow Enzyme family)
VLAPGTIGPVTLENRVMWASHATNYAEPSGEVSDAQIRYFERRARGGVGMVVSELVQVATEIDALKVTHRSLRADDERFIPGLARLVKAVHDNGAKIGIQMSPGAGAQALGGPWRGGDRVRAASPSGVVALGMHEHAMNPRALTIEEIRRIVELCGAAANYVRIAGFDLIEIHAHGGYLIHEFLSPYFNHRTDEYGGSLDNRCRFLLEIVEAVKRAAGPSIAVTVKWSVQDSLPGGWDLEQSLVLVRKLEAAGVDALGVSSGVHGGRYPAAPPYFYPLGTFLPFVEPVRAATRLPLYTSGRLDDPQLCERLLRERRLDFIQVCRALIADPDWVRKIA